MKRKIYTRTFAWLLTSWLVFMLCFTAFELYNEKNNLRNEFMNRTKDISIQVDRVIRDAQDSVNPEDEAKKALNKVINGITSYQGYEAAVYTEDGELILSTNDDWLCQYTAYKRGNTNYTDYALLDPQKWFRQDQVTEMEYLLYANLDPKKVGDIWFYSLEIKGFWLDGKEIIPKTIRVWENYADSFHENGEAKSGHGNLMEDYVYNTGYVNDRDLPYYEYGGINPNYVSDPSGNIGRRSDDRQIFLREVVLDKNNLETGIENYLDSLVTETRTGLTYRFYMPFRYVSAVQVQDDDSHISKYWVVTANEFNLLTGTLYTLIAVWLSCLAVFTFVAWILSAQTWKTFRSREELEQQRREMTNAIAHDLKTPLAVISGYAENLAENVHTEKREHYAAGIQENVRRCDRIVRDMLEISRMESGGVKLAIEPFSLRVVTEGILSRYADIFAQKEIIAIIDGSAEIRADKQLMERVLDNFFSNAVAHTAVGGTVQVSITEHRFSICNTGLHLAPEELDQVWRAYYRSDKARVGSSSGSGLGLSIVSSIFDLHGFKYSAENTETGVCFWFEW